MEGILPLWKPKGLTSHDCVWKLRKILGTKKIGHTGTLDPGVDGVLPICVGKATKIAEYITNTGKVYEGEVTLGYSTTTEDAEGEIVEQKEVNDLISLDQIQSVCKELIGEIKQTPPMFSAVKVNGKRLYEYARQGIQVERPTRTVKIYSIDVLNDTYKQSEGKVSFSFRVSCSKGTYIRTLAVTIGEKLGYPAHMSALTRIASGSFTKKDCVTFAQLERIKEEETSFLNVMKPLEFGLAKLAGYEVDDHIARKVCNGAVLEKPINWPDEQVVIYYQQAALAIYYSYPKDPNFIKPVKVLRTAVYEQ